MKWTSLNPSGLPLSSTGLASVSKIINPHVQWLSFSPADLLALFPVHSAEGAVAVEYLSCDAQTAEVMLRHVSQLIPPDCPIPILLDSSIVGWLASTVLQCKCVRSGPSQREHSKRTCQSHPVKLLKGFSKCTPCRGQTDVSVSSPEQLSRPSLECIAHSRRSTRHCSHPNSPWHEAHECWERVKHCTRLHK